MEARLGFSAITPHPLFIRLDTADDLHQQSTWKRPRWMIERSQTVTKRTMRSPPVNWHIEAFRVLVECQLVTEGCLLTMTDGSGSVGADEQTELTASLCSTPKQTHRRSMKFIHAAIKSVIDEQTHGEGDEETGIVGREEEKTAVMAGVYVK
ncbi:hypothetical protein NQZ68_015739 [Dissostichus eleginoides]|nr:hypothetical protein NQZ68_015739 [Dissostichus eleginoides]